MRPFIIALVASCAAVAGADTFEERFDDDILEPTFWRTADDGWTNAVVDGRLVTTKEEGIGGFSAARLLICQEIIVGDFTADVHVRKDAGVGSIGMAVNQLEPGWIGFSDIFFTQTGTIAGIIDASEPSQASVSSPAHEVTFRIARAGETLSLEYDTGDGFVELMARTDPILAGPMRLSLFHLEQEAAFTEPRAGSFDDLVIEADTIDIVGADIDRDGTVGISDLLALLGAWGPCPGDGCCFADIDRDGVVGISDLLVLLASWGG